MAVKVRATLARSQKGVLSFTLFYSKQKEARSEADSPGSGAKTPQKVTP